MKIKLTGPPETRESLEMFYDVLVWSPICSSCVFDPQVQVLKTKAKFSQLYFKTIKFLKEIIPKREIIPRSHLV